MLLHLERLFQERRRVDVGIAMNLAVAEELRILKTRDHAHDARLLAELQMVLKAHEIVGVGTEILLPKLHHRIGTLPRARVEESYGLHRAESQSVAPAACDLFDRQAAFEIIQL